MKELNQPKKKQSTIRLAYAAGICTEFYQSIQGLYLKWKNVMKNSIQSYNNSSGFHFSFSSMNAMQFENTR